VKKESRQMPKCPNAFTVGNVCLLIALLTSGCSRSTTEASCGSADLPHTGVVNAGIVFANETNYRCMSLEELGLPPNAQVMAIRTSCNCIKVTEVAFLGTAGLVRKGIRLLWPEEVLKDPASFRPADLGVSVEIEFRATPESDAQIHSFTLSFLHTVEEKGTRL
jgi:hypothetical protein